jgi:hypothetical protein
MFVASEESAQLELRTKASANSTVRSVVYITHEAQFARPVPSTARRRHSRGEQYNDKVMARRAHASGPHNVLARGRQLDTTTTRSPPIVENNFANQRHRGQWNVINQQVVVVAGCRRLLPYDCLA